MIQWSGSFALSNKMFSIINELAGPSERKFVKVISISTVTSGVFYVIVGLTGYLSYGDNVGGNIIMMCKFKAFFLLSVFSVSLS